jgi:hypothetical protein
MAQKVTFSNLMKYGLLLGLTLIILSLVKIYLKNFVDRDLELIFMLLQAAAYVFFIYCAIRFAVKYLYATTYSFAKGVKVGIFLGLIAAVLMCIYQYIEMKFIIPEFYQEQINVSLETMESNGMQVTEEMEKMVRSIFPIGIVFGSFITSFLIALFASLFVSPFFKKQQPIDFNNEPSDNE